MQDAASSDKFRTAPGWAQDSIVGPSNAVAALTATYQAIVTSQNGTKITLYPTDGMPFQLSCSPTKPPCRTLYPTADDENDTPSAAICEPRP